jgi:hypothetical protein
MLKLSYWKSKQDRSGKHWAAEIVNFRDRIQKRRRDSPSLNLLIESIYGEVFPVGVKFVSQLRSLPLDASISIEQALDDDWFPKTFQSDEN